VRSGTGGGLRAGRCASMRRAARAFPARRGKVVVCSTCWRAYGAARAPLVCCGRLGWPAEGKVIMGAERQSLRLRQSRPRTCPAPHGAMTPEGQYTTAAPGAGASRFTAPCPLAWRRIGTGLCRRHSPCQQPAARGGVNRPEPCRQVPAPATGAPRSFLRFPKRLVYLPKPATTIAGKSEQILEARDADGL